MADHQTLPQPLAARPARSGSRSHALLRFTRKVHLYFGVFISPALLFFAFTGAMQTFSLHEQTRGSSYKPPAWIATLAQLHKKQTTEVFRRPQPNGLGLGPGSGAGAGEQNHNQGAPGPADSNSGRHKHTNPDQAKEAPAAVPANPGASGSGQENHPPASPAPRPKSHLALKIFFLIVSIGLFLSTVTGIYMSYKYTRRAWLITTLLLAGVVLPLLLLPF
ncbi:MAG TPA: hypothetical protein VL346_05965 [Acidobacteriaceae bacterium]|nr:hypothetical protein [Acidobacteriaceae bacterium]